MLVEGVSKLVVFWRWKAWFKIMGSILRSDEKFIAEIEGVYT